jgi:aspartyl-tRNA(Asn)/glutamyl-tRNA(Gln) amidotransferase subunit A
LAFSSVRRLGTGLRTREFSAVELAEFFLDRCDQIGPRFNAVTAVTRDLALREAAQADEELAAGRDRGPLHGIPYGAKDLLAVKAYPTTWGAPPFRDRIVDQDATVVQKLREAGAVLVAKLSMVEIAGGLGYLQANAAFNGPGLNPWDETTWSGGSSSGSGSAVAAGIVPFAIGSETWGSIMTPAAYCGVTGLRPTYGRVSKQGAMTLSWTMDKLGPMARTAEDCGLVLAAIAGADSMDDSTVDRDYAYPDQQPPQPPFRVAMLKGAADNVQAEVASNFTASLEVLKDFCTFEETELPDLPYNLVAGMLISCEAAAAFEHLVRSGQIRDMAAEEDRWRIYSDLAIPATDYIQALRIRRRIQVDLDALLARYDAIATPTLVSVSGPVAVPFAQWRSGFTSTSIGGAGNAAGVPAISVPNGFGPGGLPTGLQLVSRAWDENRLLAVATAFQDRTDWHQQHPQL